MHVSAGRPGIDPGTGWSQHATLEIARASVQGSVDTFPCAISDGHIKLGERVIENMIPIPLSYPSEIELFLTLTNGKLLSISGIGAELILYGEAKYVEDFGGMD